MNKNLLTLVATTLLALAQLSTFGATGEVTLSGSTWTGRVDGSTVYTGNNMAAAVNACVNGMSSGTVNIRNSGTLNGEIRTKSNVYINGNGTTVTGGGQGGIVYAQNSSNVGASNLRMAGTSWYGMYFRTCNGMMFNGVNGTANLGFRIDNCRGGPGSQLQFGSPTSDNNGSHDAHYLETYGINGVSWGTVIATDRNGGCGLLLNQSSGASGTAVNGTRCNLGGGYAGFRVANNNGTTTLGTVNSTSCGRGFFSVSGSRDATIQTVNATDCSSHGIWLQTTANTRVNSGTVRNCNPCTSISQDLGGNSINVSCQTGGGGGGFPAAGTYSLRNRGSGRMLDNLGVSSNGANVGQWDDGSSSNQRWVLSYVSANVVKLQCVTGSRYLDGMGRTADGSLVGQWDNGSSNNQRWTIIDMGGGYFKLKNVTTGKCLDVGASPWPNGDLVEQWFDNASFNQQWQFVAP
jgi:hypothetical protein